MLAFFLTAVFSLFGFVLIGIMNGNTWIVFTDFRTVSFDAILAMLLSTCLAVLLDRLRT